MHPLPWSLPHTRGTATFCSGLTWRTLHFQPHHLRWTTNFPGIILREGNSYGVTPAQGINAFRASSSSTLGPTRRDHQGNRSISLLSHCKLQAPLERPRPPRMSLSLSTLILPADLTHEKCRLALPIHTRLHLMSGNDLSVPPSLLRFFRPPRRRRILARVPFLLVLYRSKLVSRGRRQWNWKVGHSGCV